MSKMKDVYQGMDINWYAIDINNHIGFFASGGGQLPDSIMELDEEVYDEVIRVMRSLKEIIGTEVGLNPLLDNVVGFESVDEKTTYLGNFLFMARKGMYAFDKTHVMEEHDHCYHLVATPSLKLNLESVPGHIGKIISETRFDVDFSLIYELVIKTD